MGCFDFAAEPWAEVERFPGGLFGFVVAGCFVGTVLPSSCAVWSYRRAASLSVVSAGSAGEVIPSSTWLSASRGSSAAACRRPCAPITRSSSVSVRQPACAFG